MNKEPIQQSATQPHNPLVSIIIPCFGMGKYIAEALESISQQTYKYWEILAVDDCGPQDGSETIVSAFASRYPEQRIEWIVHTNNKGVSAARNTAIRQARGDLLALLDPDDSWLPEHLERSVIALLSDDALSVVASPAHIIHGVEGLDYGEIEFFQDWERQIFPYSLGLRCGFALSGVVLRRHALKEEEVFCVSLAVGEDWDLWLRLVAQGVSFYLLPEATCRYRKHERSATAILAENLSHQQALFRRHRELLSELHWVSQTQLLWQIQCLSRKLEALIAPPPSLLRRAQKKVKSWWKCFKNNKPTIVERP